MRGIIFFLLLLTGCSQVVCNDPDGLDYTVKGITSYDGRAYEDNCIDSSTLEEFYCQEDLMKIKHTCNCVNGACVEQVDYLPAFPGAEGYGAKAVGGRGGDIIFVTNLNDNGPGSLREALEAEGPRTVLFKVGGIIELEERLIIKNPYVTLAGQTAPGGITLKGYSLMVMGGAHDVIIRGIRSRHGDEYDVLGAREIGEQARAFGTNGASEKTPVTDVIFDHVSGSWGIDGAFTVWDWSKDITIQWSFMTETLDDSYHSKGPHGFGGALTSDFPNGGISFHHNLMAHNTHRNPRFSGNKDNPKEGPVIQFYNNVIYNYRNHPPEHGSRQTNAKVQVNMIGNYIKYGPSTGNSAKGTLLKLNYDGSPEIYLENNYIYGFPEETTDNWEAVKFGNTNMTEVQVRVDIPFATPPVSYDDPEEAYELILEYGGGFPRDAVDERIVNEVRTGTGSIINSQTEVGGWPTYVLEVAPLDSDDDGMPDAWEEENNLNPEVKDHNGDHDEDGYTNIEEYINSLIVIP